MEHVGDITTVCKLLLKVILNDDIDVASMSHASTILNNKLRRNNSQTNIESFLF